MKVLIAGMAGQLGTALRQTAPASVTLHAPDKGAVDLTQHNQLNDAVVQARPALIVNCAAYTKVDDAEHDAERVFAINADGAANLAHAADKIGARLIHVSTDYVFDGSNSRPYTPRDRTAPLGVYGASKLKGETRVQEILRKRVLVLRTAWLYGATGQNFVNTMLRLMREKDRLRVVADQIGTPTWTHTLAGAIWAAAMRPELHGVYHWTDAGAASWYDFALAIQEEALALGLLARAIPIEPIRTEDYPTAARRPAYSVLDKTDTIKDFGVTPIHWRAALRQMLEGIRHA